MEWIEYIFPHFPFLSIIGWLMNPCFFLIKTLPIAAQVKCNGLVDRSWSLFYLPPFSNLFIECYLIDNWAVAEGGINRHAPTKEMKRKKGLNNE